MKKTIFDITAALLLLLPLSAHAEDVAEKDTLKLSLYFKTSITVPTVESRENIERALSVIPAGQDIVNVHIEGWASPEGTEEMNARIADRRSVAAEMFLREYFALPDNIARVGDTDWQGMLKFSRKYLSQQDVTAVESAMLLPVSQRKAVLMKLSGGRTWNDMNSEIFPLLRRADITIVFFNRNIPSPAPAVQPIVVQPTQPTVTSSVTTKYIKEVITHKDTVVIYHKDTVYYVPVDKRRDPLKIQALYPKIDNKLRRPVVAFRSNLLLPLLNVGVEAPVSNRWSVAADVYYPWCMRDLMNKWVAPQMNCLQILGGYVEGRYWFGIQHREYEAKYAKYRLLGHSLGLLVGGGYYDLERSGLGQQGEVIAAGLDYMYSLPLGKKGGVRLEFDIAFGAVYHIWHPYEVHENNGYLIYRKVENVSVHNESKWSFLPIKAGVTLSVPIFTDKPVKTKSTTGR